MILQSLGKLPGVMVDQFHTLHQWSTSFPTSGEGAKLEIIPSFPCRGLGMIKQLAKGCVDETPFPPNQRSR
ncbi:MAG: hypothetical protein VKK42_00895 [Lyngbya sp.]|nr:hypothetical protein [Lyngbya sp.]